MEVLVKTPYTIFYPRHWGGLPRPPLSYLLTKKNVWWIYKIFCLKKMNIWWYRYLLCNKLLYIAIVFLISDTMVYLMVEWTFGLFLVVLVTYCLLIYSNYTKNHQSISELNILSTRIAMYLPLMALCVWLTVLFPSGFQAFTTCMVLIQGYCIYTFTVLIVKNLGMYNRKSKDFSHRY